MKLKNGSRQVQVKRHFRLRDDNLTRLETALFEFEYSHTDGLTPDEILIKIDLDENAADEHANQLAKRLEASIAAWYLQETGKELLPLENFENGEERRNGSNGKKPVEDKPLQEQPREEIPPERERRHQDDGRPPTGPMIAKVMRSMEEDEKVQKYVEGTCKLLGKNRIKDLTFNDVSNMLDHIKKMASQG